MMKKTGRDIIRLIKQYHLEDEECNFCLPEHVYRDNKKLRGRKLTDDEVSIIFDKRIEGETLSSLSASYGVSPSRLSILCQKEMRRRALANGRINQ